MQALKELLPMDATILSLFYLKENTLEEIGEVVGMNPNSVKVKLFRARKRLADELTKNLSHEAIALIK
jgi:RNA polymerase sigma-70 factor (ECF subfamily)